MNFYLILVSFFYFSRIFFTMKKYRNIFFLVTLFCNITIGYSQYSISGYVDTKEKNKKVFLSLLKYNELTGISPYQILTTTTTDSLGYFSFEGRLLSDKHALYRIHSNIDEGVDGMQKYDTDTLKNFHNFIFSNNDSIYFEKNKKYWFSSHKNTNSIDKEWNAFGNYANKLRNEFSDFRNRELINESSTQMLLELKSYAEEKETHPLTTLILLSNLSENALEEDISKDPDFYGVLEKNLNNYYNNSLYAAQFKEFLMDISKKETQQSLNFYKPLAIILAMSCFVLLFIVFFQLKKINHLNKRPTQTEPVSLTSQEEKVADLIVEEKTNKEIATELFISLNTVKTHIRNLYAKLEVSNRKEFIEKYKNHPRD